jgi:predicted nucleic acid-binding protein
VIGQRKLLPAVDPHRLRAELDETVDASLIASIAIANGLPVVTANPRDFEGIPGLTVVEVRIPG